MDRDIAQRLIDLYNEYYAPILAAAKQKGRDEVLRSDISAFFSGTTGLAELFRGLAFGDDGKLPPEGILRNLDGIRASQKLEILYQGLSELLDFVLFSAMTTVDRHDEQELERRTQAILAEAARKEGGAGGASHAAPPSPKASEGLSEAPRDKTPSGAPIDVMDLGDPEDSLGAALAPPRLDLGDPEEEYALAPVDVEFPPLSSVMPMPPGRRTSVAFVHYLPDAEAYQLASGLTACRAEATFARERAEQIVQLAKSDELREAALRCCEHAASAIRALDELEQHVARLRRR